MFPGFQFEACFLPVTLMARVPISPMTSHQHHQRIFQLKKTIPSTNIDPAN